MLVNFEVVIDMFKCYYNGVEQVLVFLLQFGVIVQLVIIEFFGQVGLGVGGLVFN